MAGGEITYIYIYIHTHMHMHTGSFPSLSLLTVRRTLYRGMRKGQSRAPGRTRASPAASCGQRRPRLSPWRTARCLAGWRVAPVFGKGGERVCTCVCVFFICFMRVCKWWWWCVLLNRLIYLSSPRPPSLLSLSIYICYTHIYIHTCTIIHLLSLLDGGVAERQQLQLRLQGHHLSLVGSCIMGVCVCYF